MELKLLENAQIRNCCGLGLPLIKLFKSHRVILTKVRPNWYYFLLKVSPDNQVNLLKNKMLTQNSPSQQL